jgi:hypothetical protein
MCGGTAPPLANGEFSIQYFTIGPPATTPYPPATTPYLPATTLGRRKPTNDIRIRKDRQTKNNKKYIFGKKKFIQHSSLFIHGPLDIFDLLLVDYYFFGPSKAVKYALHARIISW